MTYVVILNVDGLKPDVFDNSLRNTQFLKHHFPFSESLISTFPSITFTAQCTITTGEHPETHGIPGNQFLDRLGIFSNGEPFFYALDYGKGLKAKIPAKVFIEPGLGNALINEEATTIYEDIKERGKTSLVLNHMYSRGAHYWLRPSLLELYFSKRFWKGFYNFQNWFDTRSIKKFIKHIHHSSLPDLSMLYLMGLDNVSHRLGVEYQEKYLLEVIDPLFGEIINAPKIKKNLRLITFLLISDHGQMSFPQKNIALSRIGGMKKGEPFFNKLTQRSNFSVKDKDLVFGSNASVGFLYIKKEGGSWRDEPRFSEVREQALKLYKESSGYVSGILLRDCETSGFQASYQAILPNGEITSAEKLLSEQTIENREGAERIFQAPSLLSPDIILLADTSEGNAFGPNFMGNHGGLSTEESLCTFASNRDFSKMSGIRDLTFIKHVVNEIFS